MRARTLVLLTLLLFTIVLSAHAVSALQVTTTITEYNTATLYFIVTHADTRTVLDTGYVTRTYTLTTTMTFAEVYVIYYDVYKDNKNTSLSFIFSHNTALTFIDTNIYTAGSSFSILSTFYVTTTVNSIESAVYSYVNVITFSDLQYTASMTTTSTYQKNILLSNYHATVQIPIVTLLSKTFTVSLTSVSIYNFDVSEVIYLQTVVFESTNASRLIACVSKYTLLDTLVSASVIQITMPQQYVTYTAIYPDEATQITTMFPNNLLVFTREFTLHIYQNEFLFVNTSTDALYTYFEVTFSVLYTDREHTVTFLLENQTEAAIIYVETVPASAGYVIIHFSIDTQETYTALKMFDVFSTSIETTINDTTSTINEYTITVVKTFIQPLQVDSFSENAINWGAIPVFGKLLLALFVLSLVGLTKITNISVSLAINSIIVAAFTTIGFIPGKYGYAIAGIMMLFAFVARIFENK